MPTPQLAKSGRGSDPVPGLLTAISRLHGALEALPEPDEAGYYAGLVRILDAHLPSVHSAYDACVASILITENRRVTCSKGCSACCRHFVSSVEPYELVALDRYLKSKPEYGDYIVSSYQRTVFYDDLVKTSGEGEEAGDRALYRYFLKGIPCPFLEKDGTCGVYERRPMACRMFFAESSPRHCAGKSIATAWNRNFQVELPQEAEEALARCARLLDHLEFPEDLFPGLVAANARFGRYDAPSKASPALPAP